MIHRRRGEGVLLTETATAVRHHGRHVNQEMSMRLYQYPLSGNARATLMTAYHLDADVEIVFVDLRNQEQLSPAFLEKNPNHRVSVLEDGDFRLWESKAIMQYLADKTPGQTIYPTELRARADVNRWLFWSGQHLGPAISVLFWENVVKGMLGRGAPDPAEIRRGSALFTEFAAVLDGHLAGRDWISGNALTLADLAIAAVYGCAAAGNAPVTAYPHLQSWFSRMQALDSWQRTEPRARAA